MTDKEKADKLAELNAKKLSDMIKLRQKELGVSDAYISDISSIPADKINAIKAYKSTISFSDLSRLCSAIQIEPVINFWRYEDVKDSNTKIKIKLTDANAKVPTKAYQNDAAYDLYAVEALVIAPGQRAVVNTGVQIALPGYSVGQIWPRSGSSVNFSIETGAGVIDANYRGDIKVKLYNFGSEDFKISIGDRIAQLIITHKLNADFELCELLPGSERNDAGFGSSGK